MSKRGPTPKKRKAWQPLQIERPDGEYVRRRAEAIRAEGGDPGPPPILVGTNDLYSVVCERMASGMRKLSIHRHDRRPVRDWRHLQQIKSEMLGPGALAVEVFPPDDLIFDTANEYHLWEMPGGRENFVGSTPDEFRRIRGPSEITSGRTAGKHKGRQRPFQPGLTAFDTKEGE